MPSSIEKATPQGAEKANTSQNDIKNEPKLPNETRTNRLITVLSLLTFVLFISTTLLAWDRFSPDFSAATSLNTQDEVLGYIKRYSINQLPDSKALSEGQLKGLVTSLNDPYSEYLPSKDSQNFENALNEKYQGVGVRFNIQNSSYVINKVFSPSPAEDAGLKANDEMVMVDGQSLLGLSKDDVANKVRGPENSVVKLTIKRGDQTLDINVTRKNIQNELVTFDIKGNVGIITVSSFGEDVDNEMAKIATQIHNNSNIKNLILDLRSNTGGLLTQAVALSSYLLEPNKTVVQERSKTETTSDKSESKQTDLSNYPLLILTDSYTASASEIVVASLKDNRNVKSVGQKTYGKGVVQKLYPLKNGDTLKLTVATWLTPKGNEINKKGIDPDIATDPKEDALEKALLSF